MICPTETATTDTMNGTTNSSLRKILKLKSIKEGEI